MQISTSPNATPDLSARPTPGPKNLFGETLWIGINGEIRCTRHAGYSQNNKPTGGVARRLAGRRLCCVAGGRLVPGAPEVWCGAC